MYLLTRDKFLFYILAHGRNFQSGTLSSGCLFPATLTYRRPTMSKPQMQFGCQTFTWEMLGDAWNGNADDLVEAISAAGYAGLEITDTMIGDYADRPLDFAKRIADAGLKLVSFAYGSDSGFSEPDRVAEDLKTGQRWIDFAAHFPGALVSLGSATIMSEGPRDAKFATAAEVYNRTAALGRSSGVDVAVHPSSHHNTLLFNRNDYDQLFDLLDDQVGWVPDTGHILRGGPDINDTLEAHLPRIRYVHLKDVDAAGDWAMLGAGICDVASVLEIAQRAPQFNGWVVVEEESEVARADPAKAVAQNYQTLYTMQL